MAKGPRRWSGVAAARSVTVNLLHSVLIRSGWFEEFQREIYKLNEDESMAKRKAKREVETKKRKTQLKVAQCEHEDESMIKKNVKTRVETKKRKTQMKVENASMIHQKMVDDL